MTQVQKLYVTEDILNPLWDVKWFNFAVSQWIMKQETTRLAEREVAKLKNIFSLI